MARQLPIMKWKPVDEPPKLPEPRACKSLGRIEAAELKELKPNVCHQASMAYKPPGMDNVQKPGDLKPDFVVERGRLNPPTDGGDDTGGINYRAIVPDPTAYPWCTVGKLFVGWNNNFDSTVWTGSAVLVGPNLILTASHAIPWNKPGPWLRFVPAFNNAAEPLGSSFIEHAYGIQNSENVDGQDYAICSLYDKSLGQKTGWMGWQWWGDGNQYEDGRAWTSAGYPGDILSGQVQVFDDFVTIQEVDDDGDGKSLHTSNLPYSSPGWSGGPLWGIFPVGDFINPRVLGIMSGTESWSDGRYDNVNAGGELMATLVVYGETNWPPT